MNGLSDDELAALRAEHGDIFEVRVGDELVVFMRRPNGRDLARANALRKATGARSVKPVISLARACIVHPSVADLDAALARRPGLIAGLVAGFNQAWER